MAQTKAQAKKRKKWTAASIIAFIQQYARRHGSPPTQVAVNPTRAEAFAAGNEARARTFRAMAREYRERGYPSQTTIQEHFGTFNEAIEAAGFDPRKPGRQPSMALPRRATEKDVEQAIDAFHEALSGGDRGQLIDALYELADVSTLLAAALARRRR